MGAGPIGARRQDLNDDYIEGRWEPGAMDRILIRGGLPLSGTIQIGGAKNAALPLMAASLLTADKLVLTNVPDLADIRMMANLLVQHGVGLAFADDLPGEPGHML